MSEKNEEKTMYSFLMLGAGAFVLVMALLGVLSAKACSALGEVFSGAVSDAKNARTLTKYGWCKDVVEKCKAADEEIQVIDERCKHLKAYHGQKEMTGGDKELLASWLQDRDRIIEVRNELVAEYNETIREIGDKVPVNAPPGSIKLPQELKPYVSQ